MSITEKIIESRKSLPHSNIPAQRDAKEGGCGVVGFACSKRLPGRHILKAAAQMHNRGNGKGGGVMAIGLDPQQMGVPKEILETWYLLQIAYLDETCKSELEKTYIQNLFDVYSAHPIETNNTIDSLELTPPVVYRYFVKPKEKILANFMNQTQILDEEQASDELVYQNSFKINSTFYASRGDKKAFVLSHGKNMFVFKIVGYAEQVVQYYKLENIHAHIWLGHQRYPTRGRVWHPGGAHPFVGLNEALVHNGDFANYYAITHYLTQFNITPLFLTDTEVAVLQFDLYDRVFGLSTEQIIEALAPTTEYDLSLLPGSRQQEYDFIHRNLLHVSPDGPWFFIIGRNKPKEKSMQLLAITDTSMLRPQVFALQKGKETIGLVGSEKQAIDAVLRDLSIEDNMFLPVADFYWNARGGSASNGGAFMFTITDKGNKKILICTDKFGNQLTTDNPLTQETVTVGKIQLEKVLSLDSQQRLHAIKTILARTDEKGIETVLRHIKKLPIKHAIIIYTEILNSQISLGVKPMKFEKLGSR
jgi:glutamate synthase domain-containing protein 1